MNIWQVHKISDLEPNRKKKNISGYDKDTN
jgi:hypothetical protein